MKFYANAVKISKYPKIEFPYSSRDCEECGTCKRDILQRKRKEGYYPIIYVGDGYSDRCASLFADWIFAKRRLAKILISKKRGFSYFQSFESIINWMTKKKRMIVFDLDGTIIDSYKPIMNSLKMVLNEMEVPPPSDTALKELIGIPLIRIMERFLGPEKAKKGVELFRNFYEVQYRNGTHVIRGVRPVLKSLKEKYYKLALISNKHHRFVEEILKWKKLSGFFDFYAGESDGIPPKPDPTLLNLTLKNQKVNTDETIYVGDTSTDYETASKLGIEFVAISTGSEDVVKLYSLRPHSLIRKLSELLQMISVREHL